MGERIEDEQAEAYRIIGGRPDSGLLILCDHASNDVPVGYGTLGLAAPEFERHIAYDIGAAAIAERLAAAFGAPAVLSRFSRLLIDPNRGEDDPTLIMRLSDGAVIPGNHDLTAAERSHRIQRYYRPYHQAIDRVLDACLRSGRPPMIFSVHSMTHAWKGVHRPWHVALLSGPDRRLAAPLIEGFRADPELIVGDNEPYRGSLEGDTLDRHAKPHDVHNVVIEYRQDLVADTAGQHLWADKTVPILRRILGMSVDRQGFERSDAHNKEVSMPERKPEPQPEPQAEPQTGTPDPKMQTELEAAAFRRLMAHLRTRSDVQNIDLMNLAGFCRNCLANWYQDAASVQGLDIGKAAAREHIYGMPYAEWQAKHQREATAEQKAAFAATTKHST